MKDVYGRELPPSLYQKNDTMRRLGEQRGSEIFWLNDEARKQVRQISEARPYSFTLAAASDIFVLGYIYGKRAERARRKGQMHE